jgi:hypothetical protein
MGNFVNKYVEKTAVFGKMFHRQHAHTCNYSPKFIHFALVPLMIFPIFQPDL